jgi:hypothetical protein
MAGIGASYKPGDRVEVDRRKVRGAGGNGTVIAYDPGTHTYSVRYAAGGSTERAIPATALTPATATRGRGQRTTRGHGRDQVWRYGAC